MSSPGCPVCGADGSHVTTKLNRNVEFSLPHWEGKRGHYDMAVDTCGVCTESGDFRRVNDAAITRARELAVISSVLEILEKLASRGCSRAYIERALELPSGTLVSWVALGKAPPASGVALLRLIATYPELLAVADHGYTRVALGAEFTTG